MVTRVQVRSNVIPFHLSAKDGLDRDHPVVRNTPAEEPHRDRRLANSFPNLHGELLGQCRLPAGDLDHPLDGDALLIDFARHSLSFDSHMPTDYNTESVIDNNTPSVFGCRQTSRMAKAGKISEFWRRLTLARESCAPPKSMKQKDIGREYGVVQGAVTKWKTGGPEGKSMPDPDIVTAMAIDANVSFEWLWYSRGDMRSILATDPIVRRILEIANDLPDAESKLKVLEAAIAQQTLQIPAVAARYREAQDEARRLAQEPHSRRRQKT